MLLSVWCYEDINALHSFLAQRALLFAKQISTSGSKSGPWLTLMQSESDKHGARQYTSTSSGSPSVYLPLAYLNLRSGTTSLQADGFLKARQLQERGNQRAWKITVRWRKRN